MALSVKCRYCQYCEKVRFPGLLFCMLLVLPLRIASGIIYRLLGLYCYIVLDPVVYPVGIANIRRNFNTGWIAGMLVALLIFVCGMWAAEIDHTREQTGRILS